MTKPIKHRRKTIRQGVLLVFVQLVSMVLIIHFIQAVMTKNFQHMPFDLNNFSVALGILMSGAIVIDFFKKINKVSHKNKKKSQKQQKKLN